MAFLVATTSLPAVYRPNSYARTMTAGTPHTRANNHYPSPLLTCMDYAHSFKIGASHGRVNFIEIKIVVIVKICGLIFPQFCLF